MDSTFFHSTKNILLHRVIRKCTYYLSIKVGKPLSDYYWIILLCILPLIIDVPFYAVGMNVSGMALFWVAYYMLLSYFLFVYSKNAWQQLIQVWVSLDQLISDVNESIKVKQWMNKKLNLRKQLLLSTISGVCATYVLYLLSPLFTKHVEFGIASYAQVFLNSFFGMAAIYWLWHVPLFVRQIYKLKSIDLLWYSPVDTVAIRSLTSLLAKSSLYALVGMALTVFPPLFYIDKLANPAIVLVSGLIFVLSGITVLFISVFPQYWIIEIVGNSKKRVLDDLSKGIPEGVRPYEIKDILVNQKILLFHQIKNAHMSTIDYKTVITYIVAVLLAFFPYILSLSKKLLSYF